MTQEYDLKREALARRTEPRLVFWLDELDKALVAADVAANRCAQCLGPSAHAPAAFVHLDRLMTALVTAEIEATAIGEGAKPFTRTPASSEWSQRKAHDARYAKRRKASTENTITNSH